MVLVSLCELEPILPSFNCFCEACCYFASFVTTVIVNFFSGMLLISQYSQKISSISITGGASPCRHLGSSSIHCASRLVAI
jgi:hypothetical protein